MWNIIKVGIAGVIIVFILKLAMPIIPEIMRTLKYQSVADLTNFNSEKEKELLTTKAPEFDVSEITQLLEMATEKQTVSVSIDTIVDVTKVYKSAALEVVGYNKPVWKKQTKARAKRTYSFEFKAGYNFKNSRIKPVSQFALDTLFIYLPHAEILSVESNINKFTDNVSDDEKRYEIYANGQYITVSQQNEIYANAKKLALNKIINEGILDIAETKGKYEISVFLSKLNANIKVEIN